MNLTEEKLVEQYSNKVKILSRKYYLLGGEYEDLYQDGMIGLISAIRTYKEDFNVSFSTYAEKCINRKLIDSIRSKGYVAFISDDDYDETEVKGPEELFLENERYLELIQTYKSKLSSFEFKVLQLYIEGYSYSEIAEHLNRASSSIYNAIQRVRLKLSD